MAGEWGSFVASSELSFLALAQHLRPASGKSGFNFIIRAPIACTHGHSRSIDFLCQECLVFPRLALFVHKLPHHLPCQDPNGLIPLT